ncbi:MAG: efflux RND transporter periplasmic adaptor subunit [Armatimonadota bacterium]
MLRKTLFQSAGLALAGAGVLLAVSGCGKKTEEITEHPATVGTVTTAVATAAEVTVPLETEVPGTVQAVQRADIAPKIMGRISAVYVREGDHVRKGQPLVRLEANDLAAGVSQAQAAVQNAQAAREQAKAGLEMQRTQSSVAVEQARAALEQAKAQLAKAKQGPRPEQVAQADQAVAQAKAAVEQAEAHLSLAREGARGQQKRQAEQAVIMAQQQVAQAEAGLASAKAALRTVQADYDRVKNLYDQEIMPRQKLDYATLQLEQAKQGVYQAQAAVNQANAGLSIAKEQSSMVQEGARTQEVTMAEKAVEQARAGLEQAKSQAAMAHQGGRWEDIKTAEEAVSQAEQGLRAAIAAQARDRVSAQDVKRAQAGIAQAKAGLSGAQTMQSYAVLYAPFSGVITARRADPGAMAMPQMPILTVEDDSLYQLVGSVPESVVAGLRKGQQLTVTLQSLNRKVTARVAQIVPSADPASRTFMVKANLPRTPGIASGVFGRLTVVTGQQQRLVVNRSAVIERNGLSGLYVVDGEQKARFLMVKLGATRGDQVQILSGLQPGQRVLIANTGQVTEGALVQVAEQK